MRARTKPMKSPTTRNRHTLRVASPILAIFTILFAFTAMAQEWGTGQRSDKRTDAVVPGVDGTERVTVSRLQTRRRGASAMTPNNSFSFLPPVAYDSGGYTASAAAVGDVNGDGKLDLVVGNECLFSGCLPDGAAVAVLLGNGDGTFQAAVTYGSGGSSGPFFPVSIAIADVNGDHKPDLIVANGRSNTVGVLLGNGDGTFQPAVAYGSGAFFPVSVAVADLNGDGKPDIVVANECGPVVCDGSVGVLLGKGDGTFHPVVTYSSGGTYALSVAAVDVNGDGRPDLLVAGAGTGVVGVLLGNGDGTFQAATTYFSGGAYPYSLKVADVNGDGKPDLVAANSWSGTAGVMLGNGDGTFQPAVTYSSGDWANVVQISSVAVADVNGDGRPDLLLTTESVAANGNNGGAVSVLLGNGDGTFQAALEYASGGYQTLGVTVGDVNADGRPDALIANSCAENNSGCGGPINQTRGTVTVLLSPTMARSPTKTLLVSNVNPARTNSTITYTATVNTQSGRGVSGTVIFQDGGTTVAIVTLSRHQAAYSTSYKTTGTHLIVASYSGDLQNAGSTSSSLTESIFNGYTTTTALTSSLNPSIYGQSVTWTATVTTPGSITPTGTVNFTWGYTIGSAALNSSGVATLSRANLNADSYPLTAVYVGDAANLSSTSAVLNQVVKQATSSATLTSSPNPSTQGQAVTFTAKITSPTVTPTGPVTFTAGKTVLGTAQLSRDTANLTISSLAVGSTKVTATYYGDSNVSQSSASVTQTVH